MENENIDILFNHENYELNICEQNIQLFEKYIDDYQQLKQRLSTLSDKLYHQIMVPIAGTNLAFMPGYIHHTNELLVLLGDNYFVEKSSKETIEFIDRRIKFCNEKLTDLRQQKTMISQWMKTASEMKDENEKFVNILETCTDEEHEKWLSEHNEKIRNKNQEKKKNVDVMTKNELEAFFAKYNDEEEIADDDKPKQSPIQSNIIERLQPTTSSVANTSTTIRSTDRPKSKFKASRNQKLI